MIPSPTLAIAALISGMLAALPVLISVVQTSSVEKQKKIICSLADFPVSKTEYYRLAMYYIKNIEPATLNTCYRMPILFFSFVVLFLSGLTFLGSSVSSYFETYSVVLGGAHGIDNPDKHYQLGTFVAGTWAFIGAYVYLLYRLISRINNNDIYPITFYYYTNRLVIACLVAGVARHAVSILLPDSMTPSELLAVLGFAIGWRPDLWIATIYSKFTGRLRMFHGQVESDPKYLPVKLSLNLLQGINNEDRERLEELDIKDCHGLANQNPFIVFARTSYSLLHIIDWMAQAQLAVLVGEKTLYEYREKKIRNVFVFEYLLTKNEADVAARILDISEEAVLYLRSYLCTCPCFGRLNNVRRSLLEQSACLNTSDRPIPLRENNWAQQPNVVVEISAAE